MSRNLKIKLLSASLLVVSLSVLTACNTVQGTARGVGQDMTAVSNTIAAETTRSAQPVRRTQPKKQYHHKVVKKSTVRTSKHPSANADAGDADADSSMSKTTDQSSTSTQTTTTTTAQ